ncbi:acyl carrier protein [Streptomyces sp. NPDC001941]|uniref:acyl carrier protein n=1 Tax=Streptomyces sp. NPDC001941 TaxID=3154659 RepID=UPI003317EEA0
MIANILERDPGTLTRAARLVDDLGFTAETLIDLASFLEVELSLDGLYAQARGWVTVGDVLDGVGRHLSDGSAGAPGPASSRG